jgi:hypothetical protein
MAPPDSDIDYEAVVWIKSDGTLGKRMRFATAVTVETVRCKFSASWSASRNKIRLSVPQTCLRNLGFLTRTYMFAWMRTSGHADATAARVVGRGSSPGCVTRAEFDSVRLETSRDRTHAARDTVGRVQNGNGTRDQQRQYRVCGRPNMIVLAEYLKRSDGVWHLIRKRGLSL